jgi:hypothetical protein
MAGVVHIGWYATAFKADKLAAELGEVTPLSLRYGATSYTVHRSEDDRYKFLQTAAFESHDDWEGFWHGPEMTRFRTITSGWYQVPVTYTWHEVVVEGSGPNGANGAADAA